MALKHSVRYPGQTVAPNAAYPQGSAQNVNVPGDGIGYPLEKDWVNDLFGMQQALLAAAGLTPSEVPDTALVSQVYDAIEQRITSRTTTLQQKTTGVFSPFSYGGVGDGVADDLDALQDCMDAAFAAVSGASVTVDLGGKTWRFTATLGCYPHVNVKNGSLLFDAAAGDMLQFTTPATGSTVAEWTNVKLNFDQTIAARYIAVTDIQSIKFVDCNINAAGTSGSTLGVLSNTVAATIVFEDCVVSVPSSDGDCFVSTAGRLTIRGGRLIPPPAYARSVVICSGGHAFIENVYFDLSGTSGGNAKCVQVQGGEVVAVGNVFDDGANYGNIAFYSTLAANSALLTERGNKFVGSVGSVGMTPFELTGYLSLGSSAEGLPHVNASTSSATPTVPTYMRTYSLRSTRADTTPPTITFEDPIFAGQVLHFLLGNDHTSSWSGSIILSGVNYDDADTNLADLEANTGAYFTATLVAHRYEGSLVWVVAHTGHVVLI